MKSPTGRASQRKGAAGERELAARLEADGHRVIWGGNHTYGEVPDISGLPGIHVECKRVERLNIYSAMEQATTDSKRFKDGFPTVFQRRNGEEWLVTMTLPNWLTLYNGWKPSHSHIEQDRNARAPFFTQANPPFPPLPGKEEPKVQEVHEVPTTVYISAAATAGDNRKENIAMKPKFWQNEQPIRADSGKNVLEYYPNSGALSVCKPNWTDGNGKVQHGKSVALDLDALRACPEAIKILQDIAARYSV